MMTKQQHALQKLAEECCEAGQRALKQSQFGGDEVQKGQALDNAERLTLELLDIMAAWHRCQKLGILECPSQSIAERHIAEKDAKVDRYYELSVKLGQVEPT